MTEGIALLCVRLPDAILGVFSDSGTFELEYMSRQGASPDDVAWRFLSVGLPNILSHFPNKPIVEF